MVKAKQSAVETVKELLADAKDRIRLDDYIVGLLREAIDTLSSDAFATTGEPLDAETFQARLRRYEDTTRHLLDAAVLISRWGNADQLVVLGRIVARLAAINKRPDGHAVWAGLRWYPLFLIIHAAGIAALSMGNFAAFKPLLLTPIADEMSGKTRQPVVSRIAAEVDHIGETFKLLPSHARHRVPRSEYVFGILKDPLEELLFLGEDYERYFDHFEILNALICGDIWEAEHGRVWATVGRFGYKFSRTGQPFDGFVEEAVLAGSDWPLLRQGFFKSSTERFQEVAKAYRTLLAELHWF